MSKTKRHVDVERMEPSEISTELIPETISDELDRLEIPAGKIGLNTAAQAMEFLHGLDHVYARIQDLDPDSSSRQRVEVQFEGIIARLHGEAGRFLRDVGGLRVYQQARGQVKPPQSHSWWYLDQYLADKWRAAMKRTLIIAGSLVVALIVLAVLYNRFLAPDPQTAARYSAVQSAQDALMNNDLNKALQQTNAGLQIAPNDPELLTLKGVILEAQGQVAEAQQSFAAAQKNMSEQENFLILRGQDYAMVNQPEKALADAQAAARINPKSPQAYLLMGQANENLSKYQDALDAYDKAFNAANDTNQPALAALARTRTAMLMQSMNMPKFSPDASLTATPTANP